MGSDDAGNDIDSFPRDVDVHDGQHNVEDDQTLEDLLDELGPLEEWNIDPEDPSLIDSLLQEAKDALSAGKNQGADVHENGNTSGLAAQQCSHTSSTGGANDPSKEDEQDETEAGEYVKSLLDELKREKLSATQSRDGHDEAEEEPSSAPSLNLPSVPSNLPRASLCSDSPSVEDSDLEARFANLTMNLPSTPNTAPSTKPKAEKQARPTSKLPTYTDEDIDSWCCICNEDGAVKCLGCDGDIYCQQCWRDGHGTGPGRETGHRAVQYNKRGPKLASA